MTARTAAGARGREAPRAPGALPGVAGARRGLGVLAVAGVGAGALNYAFVLVMGALLPAHDFVEVAAAQGLLLVVGSAAAATVPWLTAQRLAAVPGQVTATARAALTTSAVLALLAAPAVAAASGADPSARAALATSAALVCLGQAGVGWAQGTARFRLLAAMVLGEVAVRVAGGTLAALAGLGAAGVLWAGTAGGGLLVVVAAALVLGPARGRSARSVGAGGAVGAAAPVAPVAPGPSGGVGPAPRWWPGLAWWRAVVGVGALRGAVSAVMVVDVVVVARVLPAGRDVADYQLAMSVGRAPVFLATAVAQAYLGVLAASPREAAPRSETWRRLLSLGLPAAAVVATVPAAVLHRALPGGPALPQVLPWAAATGLAMALVVLVSTWGQVSGALRPLALGTAAAVAAQAGLVLVAARGGDVAVVAAATTGGAVAVVAALLVATARRSGARPRLLPGPWPVLAVPVLVAAHPWPLAWLVVTAVVGAATARHLLSAGPAPAGPAGR